MINNMHPGEFIKLAFIEPLGLHLSQLAEKLDVSPSTVSRIINGKMDLSYEMAVRLSIVLGRSVESWVNMQAAHSIEKVVATVDMSHLSPIYKIGDE